MSYLNCDWWYAYFQGTNIKSWNIVLIEWNRSVECGFNFWYACLLLNWKILLLNLWRNPVYFPCISHRQWFVIHFPKVYIGNNTIEMFWASCLVPLPPILIHDPLSKQQLLALLHKCQRKAQHSTRGKLGDRLKQGTC